MQFDTSAGGFFITGTDTEIGKTFISCQIIQQLKSQGISVAPRKPIASGCILQGGKLVPEDAVLLRAAAGCVESLEIICPNCFAPAVSPARAIKLAEPGLVVDIATLVAACQVPVGKFALVEGAGGFLSPIASDGLNADLAVALGLPVILVVGNRLGCINHALLSIEAIENRGLKIERIILNNLSPDADLGNLEELQALTSHKIHNQIWLG